MWMRARALRCSASQRALGALALALTANALSVTNVFPYAPFQVKFFGLTDDDRELGFYAGFFMTSYMVGCGLTAIPWGAFSDRHGKKFVIMIALLANTVPQLLFGMATNMTFALSMRLIMGLLNGLIGAAKALAPELVPPTEQAAAMSMIAATWGLGNLLGPAIGGLLSMYHFCEADEADVRDAASTRCPSYPFLLPNLVCALLSAVALVAIKCFLPSDVKGPAARAQPVAALPEQDLATEATSGRATAEDGDTIALHGAGSIASDAGDPDANTGPSSKPGPSRRDLSVRGGMLVAFYGAIALNDIIHNEVFPLWCVAPEAAGGLGLDSGQLGWILSVSGAALLLYQMVLFPPLSRRVSITKLCFVGTAASGALYVLLPFVTLFADRGLILAALLVQQALLRFSLGTAFTCTFTILNNSVPREGRGRMQGVAMTVGSLARALGPTMGAELFAWSLTNGIRFPFDVHFVFLLMCLMNAVPVAIAAVTFTSALDRPFGTLHSQVSMTAAAKTSTQSGVHQGAMDTEIGASSRKRDADAPVSSRA